MWSPTLRDEQRLGVFENRVLRIFRPKKNEITQLLEEFLHAFYSLPNITRMINEDEMSRACSKHWEKMNVYRALVGKTKGKTG
jgi:hypothetical protein